ncbi:hypothetical protein F4804DRAFT_349774 [Jackrogersella minutella]|nr:hypothetical protein F4804DRAFT_349774 [Jackrogersella minutella]
MALGNEIGIALPGPRVISEYATLMSRSGRLFLAHARLLAANSKYFQRLLDRASEKGEPLNFEMGEHATDGAVLVFVEWIQHKDSVAHFDNLKEQELTSGSRFETMVECWLFGEHIEATEFRNFVMESIHYEEHLCSAQVPKVWDSVSAKSRLRPFLVSTYCRLLHYQFDVYEMKQVLEGIPPSMVLEVSMYLFKVAFWVKESPLDRGFEFNVKEYLEWV